MMLHDMPPALYYSWIALVGLFIGSFLNVVIYRYPLENVSPAHPRRSHCPKCDHTLSWYENVPLFSWLVQRGRCRHCSWPIPWRYPFVEALNCGLWLLVARRAGGPEAWDLALVQAVFLSALVVATFVDFDCLEIPDSVSIGGMILGPILSFLVPALHQDSPIAQWFSGEGLEVTRWGALSTSLAGMALGWTILWGIGWLGSKAFGKEAMGFGDVKLLGAGGAFVGPGGVVLALMLASVLASIAGVLNMARFYVLVRSRARARGVSKPVQKALHVARLVGRYIPFGPYLAAGIGIALLYWNDVTALVL